MAYIPDSGDIVWLTFSPQAGHEQSGRRPALVLSPAAYNEKVGLALFCPITSQIKGYPFEVLLQESLKVNGVILSDQIKSLDWKIRKAEFADKISQTELKEVASKIKALLPFIG
ncbi:MAG TPA: endoribonuclease MazF [Tangfeifania sp.]|nr:endoribonuclease MazF [Tangfeifania sp.]